MKNLLLLHGAIGAKDQLEPLKKILSKKFNVYSFSFSGHGCFGSFQEFNIKQFTEDTLSFISTNNLKEVFIFGYSMGGYVALNLAKEHPDKVAQIITLGTKFKWNPEIAAKEVKMLNVAIIEAKVPAFARVLSERHGAENWKNVLSRTADMMMEMGEKSPLLLTDYQTIKTPCRLLLAEFDEMVSKEETLEVIDALQNATFKLLPNSKHPIEKVDLSLLAIQIEKMQ
jgi:pimeloyl-ACP methyl ester carboxylesterase